MSHIWMGYVIQICDMTYIYVTRVNESMDEHGYLLS